VASPADIFVASFTGANLLHGRVVRHEGELTLVELETGERVYSTDRIAGDVGIVVYPWEISLGRARHADDSALNLIEGEIRSLVHVGNRVRIRIGELTAEVTEASVEKLGLQLGTHAVATFKATGTRLVSSTRS
jgi:molybdopterin-binding protein